MPTRYNNSMSSTTQFLIVSVLSFSQLVAQPPRTFPQPAPAKEVTITAIPGIIDASAKWKLVWKGNENADGLVGYKDGLLFATEQRNHGNILDKNVKVSAF